MSQIRAWTCSTYYDWHSALPAAAIVYASTSGRARVAVLGLEDWGFDEDWTNIRVVRAPHLDRYAGDVDGQRETRGVVLRPIGHQYEGDDRCAKCGLASWGNEWPVCGDCCLCAECSAQEDGTCSCTEGER